MGKKRKHYYPKKFIASDFVRKIKTTDKRGRRTTVKYIGDSFHKTKHNAKEKARLLRRQGGSQKGAIVIKLTNKRKTGRRYVVLRRWATVRNY